MMRVGRLDVNRTIPPPAHDVSEPFGIVLIGLVNLHLERSSGVASVEADDIEVSPTELMNQPRRLGP